MDLGKLVGGVVWSVQGRNAADRQLPRSFTDCRGHGGSGVCLA
jgi:hypothetical protein